MSFEMSLKVSAICGAKMSLYIPVKEYEGKLMVKSGWLTVKYR